MTSTLEPTETSPVASARSSTSGQMAETMLRWLNIQGYANLTLPERRAISLGLRTTTGLCTVTFVGALVAASTATFWVLSAIALAAVVTPRHPFDAVWQYGVRHLVGGPPLPRNPLERRLAFLVSGSCVALIALLFGAGWQTAGYIAAAPMVAACIAVTVLHFCTPGALIALARGRIRLFTQEIPSA